MLRHLSLICTLVLSWQPATLSSEILLKSPFNIDTDFDLFHNNVDNSIPLDSAGDNELSEGLPLALPQRKSYYECGVSSHSLPLITFGHPAQYGEWPWHVMTNFVSDQKLYRNCGGTLVTLNKVITAGHCVINTELKRRIHPENFFVVAGFSKTNWTHSRDRGLQLMKVKQIALHPKYFDKLYDNDIAVVTLANDVQITHYVSPACLWDSTDNLDEIKNKIGTIVGNGVDERNRNSVYPVMGHMQYVSHYKCAWSNPIKLWNIIGTKSFCTKAIKNTNVCKGDSGSGLFYRRGNKWMLRGIASGGMIHSNGLCDYSTYSVFMDVPQFRDFVYSNLI